MLKLFEVKGSQLCTLFHSVKKGQSRALPLDQWIEAEQKMVKDGHRSPEYLSGIHVFNCSIPEVKQYCSRFTAPRDLVLVDVVTLFVRPKPTNNRIGLASAIYIPSDRVWTPIDQL